MKRKKLIKQLSEIINNKQQSHPLLVAIDEVDTSGKTILANEL